MARRLQITRYEVQDVNYLWAGLFRLRLEVTGYEDMDPRVFLYRRSPINQYTGEYTDVAITVCSPVDMEDYPPGEPDWEKTYPFFRQNWIELDFRDTAEAEEFYLKVVNSLECLIAALNRFADLKPT